MINISKSIVLARLTRRWRTVLTVCEAIMLTCGRLLLLHTFI